MTRNIHNIKNEYKNIIIEIIKQHVPDCKIFLFGSRARKTNAPESDIDIALESKNPIPPYTMSILKEEIEESRVPFCVDVVDLKTVSSEMKSEILKEKVEWKN
jgi:predicted nucleotidyltransferase